MTVQLSELTWQEAGRAAQDNVRVIIPTGATEAHGQHLPLDVDTHQAAAVATRLAERTGALVAPALPYGYSTMWMGFPGTITLSSETFQQVLVEVCTSLVRHGFYRVIILNGHRPNGTACDCAARRVVDAFDHAMPLEITAASYWEPAAAELHALRRSEVGGMGHACELETSVQLATRPQLVKMERLEGVAPPLVKWDLVAPVEPSRTYMSWPTAAEGHPGIFGDPLSASAESGERFLDAIIEGLVGMLDSIDRAGGTYSARSLDR
jgi:creatinine amidohydrolase